MNLKDHLVATDGRTSRDGLELNRIATACSVTPGFLYLVALGHKPFSPELACNVEHATDGAVDRRESLPDFPWDGPVDGSKAA